MFTVVLFDWNVVLIPKLLGAPCGLYVRTAVVAHGLHARVLE